MIRVILRVKDKHQTKNLERLGSIVYTSPILNIISLEIPEELLGEIRKDTNIVSCDIEPQGRLMPV